MEHEMTVLLARADETGAALRSALAKHNIRVIGAGLAAGMSIDQVADFCVPLDRKPPKPRQLTDEDRRRIAAAEAKRQRRAAQRTAAG